jgi:hypothetical protein
MKIEKILKSIPLPNLGGLAKVGGDCAAAPPLFFNSNISKDYKY